MQDTALVLICTLKLRDIVFYACNLINCIEINWNPVEIITTVKKPLNSTFKKSNINCYYKNIYKPVNSNGLEYKNRLYCESPQT